ncbi:MAG TPA: hypothetical protein VD927_11025 [Chryseosolibacter sp.]|nr:hypothetical protein [Chryseosolibacter sp.]
MPTYLFTFLAFAFPAGLEPISADSHLLFIGLIFIVTFLLPALNIGILRSFGAIRSFHMLTRQERILPFIIIAFVYCFITYLFYSKTRIGLNDNFMRFMIIIDLLAVVATLCTFVSKVSIHSMVAWCIIGILIPLNKLTEVNTLFVPTLLFIVLTGFIMAARVRSGVHSLKEVMWGSIAGLATGISGMYFIFQ